MLKLCVSISSRLIMCVLSLALTYKYVEMSSLSHNQKYDKKRKEPHFREVPHDDLKPQNTKALTVRCTIIDAEI